MVDFKELTRNLNKVAKQMVKTSKEDAVMQELFDKAMTYTTTDEVDFKTFTPDKIIELARWTVVHGSECGEAMRVNTQFINETLKMRPVKRVFGCM